MNPEEPKDPNRPKEPWQSDDTIGLCVMSIVGTVFAMTGLFIIGYVCSENGKPFFIPTSALGVGITVFTGFWILILRFVPTDGRKGVRGSHIGWLLGIPIGILLLWLLNVIVSRIS